MRDLIERAMMCGIVIVAMVMTLQAFLEVLF